MHRFDIIIGIAFALGGLAALLGCLAMLIDGLIMRAILCLSFGIAFVVYGILHFAAGIGAQWATPQLRSNLFLWFAIPCLSFWALNWIIDRRKKNL